MDAGDTLTVLHPADSLHGKIRNLTDMLVRILFIAADRIVQALSCIDHQRIHRDRLIKRLLQNSVRSLDQPSLNGLLLENPDIIFHICSSCYGLCHCNKPCRSADISQSTLLLESLHESQHIDRRPFCIKLLNRFEDHPVSQIIEAFRIQNIQCGINAIRINHHSSQYRLLHICRLRRDITHFRSRSRQIVRLPPLVSTFSFLGHPINYLISPSAKYDSLISSIEHPS